jgi:Domain of unknown function (DUF1918)
VSGRRGTGAATPAPSSGNEPIGVVRVVPALEASATATEARRRHLESLGTPTREPAREEPMAKVGDRIVVSAAKGAPSRRGRVIAVAGSMLTVEWDDGRMSSFFPAPGSLVVEGSDQPADS